MSLDSTIEFAENPDPRCPCVLLLDTSSSMSGEPIAALNDGIETFQQNLAQDSLAARRVEVAVVTFDSSVNVAQQFVTARDFRRPQLVASGNTSMGAGIAAALDLLETRKSAYRGSGIPYYRPWVFMITDGASTDDVTAASRRIRADEEAKRVAFFAVGVENADMERLGAIALRSPVKLQGLHFAEMFLWLSASLKSVSQSKIGEQVPLARPDWTVV